ALMITEADTCRKYVLPKLYAAGWNDDQINEQKSFTDGRIVVVGNKARRRPSKRADYLLRYARDFMLAVVEAKAAYKLPRMDFSKPRNTLKFLDLDLPTPPTATAFLSLTIQLDTSGNSKSSLRRMNYGSGSVQPRSLRRKRRRTNFSLLRMRLLAKASATIKKSQSIASYRRYYKVINGSCLQWRLEPEKPQWRSSTAGSFGVCVGIGLENTGDPRFFTLPTEIS